MNSTLTETTRKFLNAIFPKDVVGQIWLANSGAWGGGPASTHKMDPAKGNYYSPSTMKVGATTRSNASAERIYAVTADDVGANIDPLTLLMALPEGAPKPIIVTTTAKGSKLLPGQDAGENAALYDAQGVAIRDNEQWVWPIEGGADPALFSNPTLYRRLPQGTSARNGSVTSLADWGGGPVDESMALAIAGALASVTGAPAVRAKRAPGKAPLKASLADVERVLGLIDNSIPGLVSHDDWINAGIATYGSVGEAGRDAWIKWSYLSPAAGRKKSPEATWLTFPSSPTAGFGALEIIAKRLVAQPMASEAFDDMGLFPPPDDEEEDEPDDDDDDAFEPEDTKKLPRRPWLYDRRLIRGYVSATVAAGGVGKSTLTLVEALAMATGKDLLGVGVDKMPREPLRVALWSGEDPMSEMRLRINAACKHYGLNAGDLGRRLFVTSGRDRAIKLVLPNGAVDVKMVRRQVRYLKKRKVDVWMIDPLVSAHYAQENDNMAMDLVVKTIGAIADEVGCGVDLVHHTRKGNGSGEEMSVDDARGAGAVTNAVRYMRVLAPMSRAVGEKHGIKNYRAHFYVSRDAVKTNMTPPLDGDRWYRMVSVDLDNGDPFPDVGAPIKGDEVGVAEKWVLTIPNVDVPTVIAKAHSLMGKKVWRYNSQNGDQWVGHPVAEAMGLDLTDKAGHTTAKEAIDKWIKDGWLRKVQGQRANRTPVTNVEVGNDPLAF